MLKHPVLIGLAIACPALLSKAAIAMPLVPPVFQSGTVSRVDTNAPLCYIQFQGSSTIDVSNVCGKTPGETPANATAVAVSSAAAPPVFDPKVTNASTTGQCNFIDANGNPCVQK